MTSMKPVPQNRVTTKTSASAVQFDVVPDKKCYKIVK
jgi:hypothetical protein